MSLYRAKRRRFSLAAVTLAVALVSAACGGTSDNDSGTPGEASGGGQGEPVKIGVISSLTGPGAVIGVPFTDAAKIAAEAVNAEGGLLDGRPMELVIKDDESKPEVAVQHFQDLKREGAVWVQGPNLAGTCYATEPLSQQLDLPMYCWSAADLPPDAPFYFGGYFDFTQVAKANVEHMKEEGVARLALLSSTDASGKLYEETMKEAAAQAGITISDARTFEPTDTDLTSALSSLRGTDPDAYFIGASGKSAAVALKNASDLQLKEPFYIGFGNASFVFADLVGNAIPEKTYVAVSRTAVGDQIPDDDPQKPQITAYTEAWEEAYDSKVDPVSSITWDTVHIVAEAIRETGSVDPGTTMAYIEGMTWAGASCVYEFSATDHRGADADCPVLTRFTGDGTFELVERAGS